MDAKLTRLYNTLSQIETKGENTKIMGVCLQFVEQLIAEVKAEKAAEPKMTDPATEPKKGSKKGAKAE